MNKINVTMKFVRGNFIPKHLCTSQDLHVTRYILFPQEKTKKCTSIFFLHFSGHGLSGMGLLNLLSMATVAAMFVGGIVTAQVLNRMN